MESIKLPCSRKSEMEISFFYLMPTVDISLYTCTKLLSNLLQTLVRVNCLAVVPCLLEQCRDLLASEELTKISSEEYNIFLWPEGELYDTSVIDKLVSKKKTIIKK